jgi:hypothetical protein
MKRLTGLCFIGKVRLQILQQKITTKEGLIYEIDSASQYIP